jgi:fibronectin-binding autotransporter adhesin
MFTKLYSLLRVPHLLARNLMHIRLFPFVLFNIIPTSVFSHTRARTCALVRAHARKLIIVAMLLLALLPFAADMMNTSTVYAASNSTINFQARLLGTSGAVVTDGTYNIEFKLYSASSGGTALWTEDYLNSTSTGVNLVDGYFSVSLGSITPFPSTINWDQSLYLTMNIGGTTNVALGSVPFDGEMNPRLPLTSVPYALRAGTLAQQNGAYENTLSWVSGQTQTANDTISLPNASGTLCLENDSADCGYANGTTDTSYIQNSNVTPGPETASFNIQGSGSATTLAATTSLTAPLVQAPTSTALTVQGGAASGTNTAGSNLALQGGAGTGSASGGNITFNIANTGASGATLNGYASAPVLTISGTTGAATFENVTNSANALAVENATAAPIFNVSTTGSGGVAVSGVPPATAGASATSVLTVTGPAGAANTAAAGIGGNGAGTVFTGGNGGAETNASSGTGGIGGTLGFTAGTGGAATAGTGGAGGGINLQSGNGGTGTTQGVGGNVTLSAGSGSVSGSVIAKNQANSTTAFQVQNTSGADALDVSTNATLSSSSVGIDGVATAGGAALQVSGSISLTSQTAVTGNSVAVCRDTTTGLLTYCDSNTTGKSFLQGGNSFGATAVLGTDDANTLSVVTNNIQRIGITSAASGNNSTLTFTGLSVFQPTANSATAFQVQTAGSTPSTILNVDTTNSGAVTISGLTPTAVGTSATTVLTVTGPAGSANSTAAGSGGAGAGTSTTGGNGGAETSGSSGTGGAGGTLSSKAGNGGAATAGAGGVGGAVNIQSGNGGTGTTNGSGGNINLSAGSAATGGTGGTAGSVIVKNQSNSTIAFQVQNTSSSDLLDADTTDNKVSVGAAVNTAGSTLQVTGDLSISSLDTASATTSTYLCLNSSNQVATCSTSNSNSAFVQGGNSFGTLTNNLATIGTNDTVNGLSVVTGGIQRIKITNAATGNATLTFNGASTFQPTADSSTAFQVQDAAGTPIVKVDTSTSGAVTIAGVTPGVAGASAAPILTVTGPAGAANTAAAGVGGAGAGTSTTGGNGGAETSGTSGTGGAGGTLGFTAGTGGAATAGTGGAGGTINLQSGNGGTGTTQGVGGNVNLSAGSGSTAGSVIVKNQSNSAIAFQVQNTSSADLLDADTTDNKLSVGASVNTAGSTLQVTGDLSLTALDTANTSTYLCLNSTNQVSTCSTSTAGSAFVQGGNAFTSQGILGTTTSQNLEIGTGNGTALQQRILITSSASSTTNAALTFNGTSTFQPTADSTTAFQVQDAAGTSIVKVDSTNSGAVTVGGVTPTGTTGTSAAAIFTVNGPAGATSASATAGGNGANVSENGGTGGANTSTGVGGNGGALSYTAGAGGASTSAAGGTGGAVTLAAGIGGTGTGGTGGAISLLAGNGAGTNGSAGNVTIDSGARTGTGTLGAINIGTTNASAISLGNATSTTVDSFAAGTYGLKVTNTGVGITSGGAAITPNADLSFAGTAATRTIDVLQNSSGNGTGLTVQAGSSSAATSSGGNVTIQAGTGTSTNGTVIVKSVGTDSTTNPTFEVQNASGTAVFNVIASTTQPLVIIGNPAALTNLGYQSTDNLIAKQAEFTGQLFVGNDVAGVFNGLTASSTSTNAYEPLLSGSARHPIAITLAPEYPDATLTSNGDGTNVGTMTAGFCANSGALAINTTICASGQQHNYYSWTASATNDYDVFTKQAVPSNFSAMSPATAFSFYGRGDTATETQKLTIYNTSTAGTVTNCGSISLTGSGAWTQGTLAYSGLAAACQTGGSNPIAAGSTLTFDVHLSVGTTGNYSRAGEIGINYLSSY